MFFDLSVVERDDAGRDTETILRGGREGGRKGGREGKEEITTRKRDGLSKQRKQNEVGREGGREGREEEGTYMSKRHHAQPLQLNLPRQSHIRLPVLKHTIHLHLAN